MRPEVVQAAVAGFVIAAGGAGIDGLRAVAPDAVEVPEGRGRQVLVIADLGRRAGGIHPPGAGAGDRLSHRIGVHVISGGVNNDVYVLVGRIAQDDATGNYRVDGMEPTDGYTTELMPASTELGYPSTVRIADNSLTSVFPTIINSLHADGSTQDVLQITAGTTVPGIGAQGTFTNVESAPPYTSFKTFSFFAKFSSTASLNVQLDDGATPTPNASAQISLPAGSGNGAWHRYLLHYGNGDPTVYEQDGEGAPERAVPGATSTSPSVTSTGSRLMINFSTATPSDQASVDEVMLEDSVGSLALLFRGRPPTKFQTSDSRSATCRSSPT